MNERFSSTNDMLGWVLSRKQPDPSQLIMSIYLSVFLLGGTIRMYCNFSRAHEGPQNMWPGPAVDLIAVDLISDSRALTLQP